MKIPKNFTQECVNKLTRLYPNSSQEVILKEFPQYQWRSLQNIANELGLKREFSSLRKGKIENLFDNSNESYYWLGLIASDGTLKVELAIKDKEYLNNLANFLEVNVFEYPKYESSKSGSTGTCRIKIKNIKEGKKLRDLLQIEGKKTYNPISLDFIKTKEQFIAFLAGYIDGDGTITYKNSINICGHKNMYPLFQNIESKFKNFVHNINLKYLFYKDMVRISFNVESSIKLKLELDTFL